MRDSLSFSILLTSLLSQYLVLAHPPVIQRQVASSVVAALPAPVVASPVVAAPAATRSTWQEAYDITSKTQECRPYYYAPVSNIVNTYPTVWQTANLAGSGIPAADIAFFNSINSSIPNIAPRGTRDGNFTGVVYSPTDPDCWWTYGKCTTPKVTTIPDDIVRCVEPNSYGYTLDDGPNCSHNAFYEYLRTQNQKATLFYIGSNVINHPLEAQAGLAEGHDICAHTWSHPYMTAMTNEEAFAELYYAKKAIYDVMGIEALCWRPPYGDVDDRIRWIAQRLGMVTMMWSADTSDWKVATLGVAAVEANYEAIIAAGKAGTYANQGVMVLAHELNNQTMSLAEQFLPQIQATFKGGVMPMAVCMNNTQPYGEQDGKYVYPNYEQWQSGTRSITLAQPTAASRILNIVPSSSTATATASSSSPSSSSSSSTTSTSTSEVPITALAAKTTSASSKSASNGSSNIMLSSSLVIFTVLISFLLV